MVLWKSTSTRNLELEKWCVHSKWGSLSLNSGFLHLRIHQIQHPSFTFPCFLWLVRISSVAWSLSDLPVVFGSAPSSSSDPACSLETARNSSSTAALWCRLPPQPSRCERRRATLDQTPPQGPPQPALPRRPLCGSCPRCPRCHWGNPRSSPGSWGAGW